MEGKINYLEAIGYVIMVGIILGVILTTVWIGYLAIKGDPDFEDEDDREIHEHEYWDKNKKA